MTKQTGFMPLAWEAFCLEVVKDCTRQEKDVMKRVPAFLQFTLLILDRNISKTHGR
jgi:hypothetical protein